MIVYTNRGMRHYDISPVRMRRRRLWEFQAVLAGRIRPTFERRQEEAAGASLWLFGPDNLHGWRGDGSPGNEAEVAVFHFDRIPRELERLVPHDGVVRIELDSAATAAVRAAAAEAGEHFARPRYASDLLFSRILLDLTLLLLDGLEETVPAGGLSRPQKTVARALSIFESEMEFGAGVADVARLCGTSVSHLRRLFYRVEGRSPAELFDELRLRRALELLTRTDISVTDIALTCGFASHSAFSRRLRRYCGRSPREVRRRGGAD